MNGDVCFVCSVGDEDQTYTSNRFSKVNNRSPQDSKQVWFAGAHADIGGGYPEQESGLSKYPLLWMIEEAKSHGLEVATSAVNQLAWGRKRQGSPFSYVPPDFTQLAHQSLSGMWRAMEWVPKSDSFKEWRGRQSAFGHYLPRGEPRTVPEGAFIHESVLLKIEAEASYKPINMPKTYSPVPVLPEPEWSAPTPDSDISRGNPSTGG